MTQVNKLLIFLASPGDVKRERRHVEKVVQELNVTTAPRMNVVLDVIKYEEDAVPGYGMDAQAIINNQVPEMPDYSLFVGIMWNRLGTPTPRAESGTVEEFERAAAAYASHGRPQVWFYFSEAPPARLDIEQLELRKKVLEFKSRVSKNGLPWSYKTPADFRDKFRAHLAQWLNSRVWESKPALDLTGEWFIDDGNSQYAARLKQEGSHVSGEYALPGGGSGALDGQVEGDQLSFTWEQSFNRRGGGATMEISPDGRELDGKWFYDPAKYGSGLTGRGKWTFYRK